MLRIYATRLISKQRREREAEITRSLTPNSMSTVRSERRGKSRRDNQSLAARCIEKTLAGNREEKDSLVFSAHYGRAHRPESKESVEDALIDQIQLGLKRIEEFMQTARDDLTSVGVRQIGTQLTETLLGGIAIHSNGRTRNRMKGVIRGGQTIMDRARELVIEHEKFNN